MMRTRFRRPKEIGCIVLALAVMLLGSASLPVQADPHPAGVLPPPGLSAADWTAILDHLGQAESLASLIPSQKTKLMASDAAAYDEFGFDVAVGGDTVVVGAPYDNSSFGSAYIFARNHGGADNWGQVKELTASDAVAGDYFGMSVAISGDTIVIGAYGDDAYTGSAYVFERNECGADQWDQVQKLTADTPETYDRFGRSVAISGDTIVVGAWEDDDTGTAYVFERNWGGTADNWGRVKKLTASDAASGDWFGFGVAISGDTVVVGASFDDDAGASSGSAYVFERNWGGADQWGQVQKLTASGAAAGDRFGLAVSISGDTVVVGAHEDDDTGTAYVFERNQGGADQWGQVQKLTASDAAAGDYFGYAVAISGDTVLVGAYADDDGGDSSGSAYVFERNQGGADHWGQATKLTAGDAAAGDAFGFSVDLDGNTFVAGAHYDDHGGKDRAGSAYLFARQGAMWNQQAKPLASDPGTTDYFGFAVAVSGDTAVVGAPRHNSQAGAAYVFERNRGGADNWGQVQKLMATISAASDEFGKAVAISGDTIVVGAPKDDDACPTNPNCNSGSAYVFERNECGADAWAQVEKLTASDDALGDEFAISVAISGDTAVVGAWYDDDAGSSSGSAYVFTRNQGGLADHWGQTKKVVATDDQAGDYFGKAVAISGDTVVVGAYYEGLGGSAYVFERNRGGADQWGQIIKLTADDATGGEWFGHSVAISNDTVVVGAPLDNGGLGSAYVFERNENGADVWGQVDRLAAEDAGAADYFGWSVAISKDTVAVGEYLDDEGGNAAGAAYVFERNQGGADAWGQVAKLTADDAAAQDWFGHSVGLSGNTVVVGAYFDDDGADAAGSAYVYRWTAAHIYLPLVLRNF